MKKYIILVSMFIAINLQAQEKIHPNAIYFTKTKPKFEDQLKLYKDYIPDKISPLVETIAENIEKYQRIYRLTKSFKYKTENYLIRIDYSRVLNENHALKITFKVNIDEMRQLWKRSRYVRNYWK